MILTFDKPTSKLQKLLIGHSEDIVDPSDLVAS